MKNTTRKSSDKKQGHQQFTRRACGNTNRVVSRRGSKSEPENYHVSAYNTSNLKKQELVCIPSTCRNLTIEHKNLGDRWCLTCGGYLDHIFLPGVNVVVTGRILVIGADCGEGQPSSESWLATWPFSRRAC